MDDLLFLCPWEKSREQSWSGSHNAMYNELLSYYNVIDYSTRHFTFIDRIEERKNYIFRKTIGCSDMGIVRRKREGKKIKKLSYHGSVFSFEETPILDGCRHFVYQDLYVRFLKELYERDFSLFKKSGFGGISYKGLCKRTFIQTQYYNAVDGILTMGEWLKEYILQCDESLKGKVHHIGGGCNIDLSLKDQSQKQGNKILFVGKAFRRKNGHLVVEAFLKARKIRNDIWLYIVGPEGLSFNQDDNIVYLGRMNFKELPNIFNLCDIFCMPSLFEAYGLVFAEALLFGLPCIGNNCFEMPYFIEDNETGYLLKRNSSDELAIRLLELLDSSEIKKNVDDRYGDYLSKYSWNSVAKRAANIIK